MQGAVDTVVSRGAVIVHDGEYAGREGHGRFVARQPFCGLDVPLGTPPG